MHEIEEDVTTFVMEKMTDLSKGCQFWCVYPRHLGKSHSSGIVGFGRTTDEAFHDLAYSFKKRRLAITPEQAEEQYRRVIPGILPKR